MNSNRMKDPEQRNRDFYNMVTTIWKDRQRGLWNENKNGINKYAIIFHTCKPKKDVVLQLVTLPTKPTYEQCAEVREQYSKWQKQNRKRTPRKAKQKDQPMPDYSEEKCIEFLKAKGYRIQRQQVEWVDV